MESTEKWLPVVGYEGIYEVSDHGGVRSIDRVTPSARHASGFVRRSGRELKRAVLKSGHEAVSLSWRGHVRKSFVHHLVMEAFICPAPLGRVHRRHLDGNPRNNRVDNLAYGTPSDNAYDRVRHGNHHLAKKTHCKRGHRLDGANLYDKVLEAGRRSCLACLRGRVMRDGRITVDQAKADRAYSEIMTNETK